MRSWVRILIATLCLAGFSIGCSKTTSEENKPGAQPKAENKKPPKGGRGGMPTPPPIPKD